MKILLTGGAGFIGSYLVEALIKQKNKIVVVDNLIHPVKNFQKILKGAKFYRADIRNYSLLRKIFLQEKPEIVNHHAAEASINKVGISIFENNVLGTLNLLKLARDFKIKKFIFASSAAVYGKQRLFPIKETVSLNPLSVYGISKWAAEYYLNLYQKDFIIIILRYSNVYGWRQDVSSEGGVVSIFIHKILNKEICQIYGDGEQIRDFIFVADVVNANLKCLKSKKSDIFNISTGRPTSVFQLLELLKKITKKPISYQFVNERVGEIKKNILDNTRAKKLLKWQPAYSLEEGLRNTLVSAKH